MALLASYMDYAEKMSLADFLSDMVFTDMESDISVPEKSGSEDFKEFMKKYRNGLAAQKSIAEI